jgi:hypothetical protein
MGTIDDKKARSRAAMTQGRFDSIAEGERPPPTADARSAGCEPATGLEALWTELLVQLSHTVQECAQPEAIDRLKKLGIRRPQTAAVRLAREYVKTFEAACDSGFALRQQAILQRAGARAFRNDLDHDFRELARSYERLIEAAAPPKTSLLLRWLQGRMVVHLAQADALMRGM